MATTAMATVHKTKLCCIFIGTIALNFCADAAEFRLKPALKLESTYTDNVELTKTEKTSSVVTQVGVVLNEVYNSKVLEFEIDLYSRYGIYSHDKDLNKDFHDLKGNLKYSLWPNGINFVAQADITNESRNSARNAVADIISGDTVQVQRYDAGLQYALDNRDIFLDSTVGYRRTYSEDNIGEQQGYFGTLVSENSDQAEYLFWDLYADYQYLENLSRDGTTKTVEMKLGAITPYRVTPFVRFYDESNTGNISNGNRELGTNSYGIGARWLATPRLFFDLSFNKPKDDQIDLDGNELTEYVDAKVSWQPSARTKLDASFSQRFYGNSYYFNLAHRNRRLTNNIVYEEQVLAFTRGRYEPELQGYFWCPKGTIEQAADCFIQSDQTIDFDNYVLVALSNLAPIEDNEFSLNKSMNWSTRLELPRTSFSLRLSANKRISLSTTIEDETYGASLSIKRKVSGKSSVSLIATYNDDTYGINTDNERKNRYVRYSAEYNKQLGSELDTTAGISHLDRESSLAEDTYQEGRIYFQIKKGF